MHTDRRPPPTLQQVLVLREARRSQDKGGEKPRSRCLALGASACFLSSHRQRRSSFVFLARPGLGSRHHCLQWRGFRGGGEGGEHLSVKLSPLIHIQQNSEQSETLESCIGGGGTTIPVCSTFDSFMHYWTDVIQLTSESKGSQSAVSRAS